MECVIMFQFLFCFVFCMGIYSYINNGSSYGSSNIVVVNYLFGLGDMDVFDKVVVVGECVVFQCVNCVMFVECLWCLQLLFDEVCDLWMLVLEFGFESVEGVVVKVREFVECCGLYVSWLYMVS